MKEDKVYVVNLKMFCCMLGCLTAILFLVVINLCGYIFGINTTSMTFACMGAINGCIIASLVPFENLM